jgi:DnaJ-class molecular chaperone
MSEKNPYKLLQVDPQADTDVIAAAYRALAGKLHPERDFTGIEEYRLAELKRAYALLTDAARRRAYDAEAERVAFTVEGPGHHSWTLADRIAAKQADDNGAKIRIDFGRYAGRTLGELLRADPEYLRWLSRHSSGIRFRGPILRLLAELDAEHSAVGAKPQP